MYAKTDESIDLNKDYIIGGNRISVKTLDLNTDFSDIEKQLNEIVEELNFRKSCEHITLRNHNCFKY